MSSKTEQPTRQRRERARREGQLPRSRLFPAGASTFFGLWALVETLPAAYRGLALWTTKLLSLPSVRPAQALEEGARRAAALVLPCLGAATAAAGLAALGSAGLGLHLPLLVPRLERISPAKGLGRLWTLRTVADLAKSCLAAAVVATVFWMGVRESVRDALLSTFRSGPEALVFQVRLLWPALEHAAFALLLLGAADFGHARWRHHRDLMMTREEVKREHRESEGDPQAKGKRRSLHRQLAQGGPQRGVASATALVVNPTHLAVALRYEPRECDAPYLVAKARRDEALELRRAARAEGIPIVKDVALARSLIHYDVGEEVPEELYRAAAAVLKVAQEQGAPVVEAEEET